VKRAPQDTNSYAKTPKLSLLDQIKSYSHVNCFKIFTRSHSIILCLVLSIIPQQSLWYLVRSERCLRQVLILYGFQATNSRLVEMDHLPNQAYVPLFCSISSLNSSRQAYVVWKAVLACNNDFLLFTWMICLGRILKMSENIPNSRLSSSGIKIYQQVSLIS